MSQTQGGATTSGPDATHPPAICQNSGGGGVQGGCLGGGGSAGGCRWGVRPGGGFPRWGGGGLRATHYYHMHTSWGDVCLGVSGYLALKSTDGLMKRKHTLKKGGEVGAMPPTHYLSKPGGGGGGLGGSHTRTGPGSPPPWSNVRLAAMNEWSFRINTTSRYYSPAPPPFE